MKKAATLKKDDIFRDAEKVFSKSYVALARAKGRDFLEQGYADATLSDADGQSYLDCYTSGGSFNLGRRNATIIERFKKAIYATDQGNFVMPSQEKALLAKKISEFVPGNLDCVLYGVTRGESMEAACKLARGFTGRPGLVTVDGGCYGESGFALSLSDRAGKEQFGQLIPAVTTIPYGDIEAAKRAINSRTAAVVMEPIQAENNCRMADTRYSTQIRDLCTSAGAKLIFDETQSGFGRTGTRFFFEQLGVTPDILIIGEAITSGMFPMTAMVFTPELKGFFDIHPLIHLCTFGGHDIGCLVAMTAINEYDRLEPWTNAAQLGDKLLADLSGLIKKGGLVSVNGKGLLIALKFSAPEAALSFCAKARANGMLADTGKVDQATVVLRPSLLITPQDADRIVAIVAKTLETV